MCLTIPPIKIRLVDDIFGVKNNMMLSTGDVCDFYVICGFWSPSHWLNFNPSFMCNPKYTNKACMLLEKLTGFILFF